MGYREAVWATKWDWPRGVSPIESIIAQLFDYNNHEEMGGV